MTLRARLTLLTAGVLLLSLLAFAGVAGTVLWRVELASIARQVAAQADALIAVAEADPRKLDTGAFDVLEENGLTAVARVYDGPARLWGGGAAGPPTLDPTFLTAPPTGPLTALRRVGNYLVASHREGTLRVQVGRNLEPLEHLLAQYAVIAVLTLIALSALGGGLAAAQVRRTLGTLDALVRRVQHLEAPHPLPGLDSPDEVGALSRALDGSLRALRAERTRETLFLASASHELRTPVTAMLADVQHTLSRPRPPEELRASLERTERAASRLRSLTGNLMTLTRTQRLPEHTGPERWPTVDVLDLAGESIDLLQPLALRRELDLWLDGEPSPVQGEKSLLGSVLENLIGNAIKFTPPGGEVRVDVRPLRPHGAQLTVHDTGPGFPEGDLTGTFVRGHSEVEGFGLGLAVVRQVVEAHGGVLRLESPAGGGAVVVVTLPGWPGA